MKKKEKSSVLTWAEREVALACKKERDASGVEDAWDYGCACYESALRAFKSLERDGHSGFSIHVTKHILVRLIEGKPLTPIEDTDDIWNDVSGMQELNEGVCNYQCKRMSSLFKKVDKEGNVTYKDVNMYYGVEEEDPNNIYHSGLIDQIANEMWPITMPYMPGKPIKFVTSTCLVDRKNGDYDTRAVLYAVKDDERILINRYFKAADDGWDEISENEYLERVVRAAQRIEGEMGAIAND